MSGTNGTPPLPPGARAPTVLEMRILQGRLDDVLKPVIEKGRPKGIIKFVFKDIPGSTKVSTVTEEAMQKHVDSLWWDLVRSIIADGLDPERDGEVEFRTVVAEGGASVRLCLLWHHLEFKEREPWRLKATPSEISEE